MIRRWLRDAAHPGLLSLDHVLPRSVAGLSRVGLADFLSWATKFQDKKQALDELPGRGI